MIKLLKSIPAAVYVNAQLKSVQTRWRYQKWCKRYESYNWLDFKQRSDAWRDCFASDLYLSPGNEQRANTPSLRRFFYISNSWDQDRAGLIQGLETQGQVRVFKGPDKKNELRKTRNFGDISSCQTANSIALEEEYSDFCREGPVTAVIGQIWGFSVHPSALSFIRKSGAPIINICMDDRHSFHLRKLTDGSEAGTAGTAGQITLAATAAPECVRWWGKLGTKAIFFPEASDGTIFKPMNLPKVHDITFVGANYGFRGLVVNSLRRAGLNVTTFGDGWPEGRINTEAIPALFAQSKIVLGIGGILHCNNFAALKMRDFDATMSGSFYLAQENPDLAILFRLGEEIETWSTIEDLVAKCRKFLFNCENEREHIALRGRLRSLAEHTWEKRFGDLLLALRSVHI
jgi:hypothetical protein